MNGPVLALAKSEMADIHAIFAGGRFTTAGGVAADSIALWTGNAWTPIGEGINDKVYALEVWDDGSGPALYVGGEFVSVNGLPCKRIARWDGISWKCLGNGLNGLVLAMAAYDDQTASALYVGGIFTVADNVRVNYIAKWDGIAWSAIETGANNIVYALKVFGGGDRARLFIGGGFSRIGRTRASGVAAWDGQLLIPADRGLFWPSGVSKFEVYDDGSGFALYAKGTFYFLPNEQNGSRIAKWDGVSWSGLPGGVNWSVYTIGSFDDGRGPALYAGGPFETVGGALISNIARWDGS
jgi:hypothetical protein